MPAKLSGQIKTSVVKKPRKDGDTYIFERKTIHDPEKKYTKILCTKLIARIPKDPEIPVPILPKHGKILIHAKNWKFYQLKTMLG